MPLKNVFFILLCDRGAYFFLSLIDSSVSLWVVPGNRSNGFVELFHLLWQVRFSLPVDIFYAKEKAAFGMIHLQRSSNVSFELVRRVRFKAKGQMGLAPTLRLLCPPALFFHRFSRSAGIFRHTKTSRCHVTGGPPPLNNACLF